MVYSVEELKRRIAPVAEKYGLREVYLFDFYARNEATEQSDVTSSLTAPAPISAECSRWAVCMKTFAPASARTWIL